MLINAGLSWTIKKKLFPPAALKKVFSEDNEIQKTLDEDFIVINLVVSYFEAVLSLSCYQNFQTFNYFIVLFSKSLQTWVQNVLYKMKYS